MSKKKKTLQQIYRAPMPVNEEFAGAPADMSQVALGPWPQPPVRGVEVQMGTPQIVPPVRSVQVQMGEPRIVPPILPPPPEDPRDVRAAALERGERSSAHAMMPALQQMGPASGRPLWGGRWTQGGEFAPPAEDVPVDTRIRQVARPEARAKAPRQLEVAEAAKQQYEFYKQAGLPENEALNRARADALLYQNYLSRREED